MDSSFDNQVIFKLATIETKVQGISDNLIAAVHRLEDKIAETHQQQTAATTEVKTEMKAIEKRLSGLEKYRDNLIAKVSGVMVVVTLMWAMFGKAIEATITEIF